MSSASRKLRRAAKKQGPNVVQGPSPARRVHLQVVRDQATGAEQIKLQLPVFSQAWQNKIVEGVAQLVHTVFGAQMGHEGVVLAARAAMEETSKYVGQLLQLAPQGALACRAACSHCCYQRVGVTAPEALAIVAHLKQTLDEAALFRVKQKVRLAHEKTHHLSAEQRLSPELPCPLLDNQMCSVYEVRPLSCRGVHSLDEAVCASKLYDENTRQAFLKGEIKGHFYDEPLAAFHAVSAGLQLSLAEQFALDMHPLELISALALLLGPPRLDEETEQARFGDQLTNSWLLGKPAFEAARGGDAGQMIREQGLSASLGLSAEQS